MRILEGGFKDGDTINTDVSKDKIVFKANEI